MYSIRQGAQRGDFIGAHNSSFARGLELASLTGMKAPSTKPSAKSADWFFFDHAERELVAAALDLVGAKDVEHEALLRASLERLERLAALIRDTPSIVTSWRTAAGRPFSGESLIELLCRVPDYDLDLHVPTKATVGQGYLVAKINFLKALSYAVTPLSPSKELALRLEHEIGQSIYSKLAEELFVSIVTDEEAPHPVKVGAARFLFRIWDERLLIEVDDFAPLLESVWRARSKVLPLLGTMLGTYEVFQLFREACDPRFLDYFGTESLAVEQLLSFEEFLFGLSYEEIQRLRKHMQESAANTMTLEQARTLLGRRSPSWASQHEGAQAFYTSYKKRRVNARFRTGTGAEGPKRTAEEYVMMALLQSDMA
jgi:hypothetical protein